MKRIVSTSLFLATCLINTSNAYCVTAQQGATKENPIQLKKDGESYAIELKSNPSTGFSWSVSCTPMNKVGITKDYKKKPSTAYQGAGGIDVFTITPQETAEEITCTFEKKRLWEDKAPVESKKYYFSITE